MKKSSCLGEPEISKLGCPSKKKAKTPEVFAFCQPCELKKRKLQEFSLFSQTCLKSSLVEREGVRFSFRNFQNPLTHDFIHI